MQLTHVRGLLLEEVALHLMRAAGFSPAVTRDDDPTLYERNGSLFVRGRGGSHQADALGDLRLFVPFSHPIRLILEAKCYPRRLVDLRTIRNAVGVMRDIEQFFRSDDPSLGLAKCRYHYLYTVFSATDFTRGAQEYAYAHDVNLFPFARNSRIQPIIRAILDISERDLSADNPPRSWGLSRLRSVFRTMLDAEELAPVPTAPVLSERLMEIARRTRSVGGSVLARAGGQLLLYLVPTQPDTLDRISRLGQIDVKIYYDRFDQKSWYITDIEGHRLFSFDLPLEVFEIYAQTARHLLTRTEAANVKRQIFSEIEALHVDGNRIGLIVLRLDEDWISEVESEIVLADLRREPDR